MTMTGIERAVRGFGDYQPLYDKYREGDPNGETGVEISHRLVRSWSLFATDGVRLSMTSCPLAIHTLYKGMTGACAST